MNILKKILLENIIKKLSQGRYFHLHSDKDISLELSIYYIISENGVWVRKKIMSV